MRSSVHNAKTGGTRLGRAPLCVLAAVLLAAAGGLLYFVLGRCGPVSEGAAARCVREEAVTNDAICGRIRTTAMAQDAASRRLHAGSLTNDAAARRVRRGNGWERALGTNRLAAAERALRLAEEERELTPDEEALVGRAHEIVGEGDAAAARAFAAAQLKAEHPKVREAAVFALANCGSPCLAELTPFLADSDEAVRIEAFAAWNSAWFDLPEGDLKANSAATLMCVLDDEQAMGPIATELTKFDRQTALEVIQTVLENGTPAGRAVASRMADAIGLK